MEVSQIIILFILIMMNAFFAASEIAFISLNDAKVERKAKEGDKKSKLISRMLKNPSKFLATIQIGITLAGFLSSAFASEALAGSLAEQLNKIIPIGISVLKPISIIIITVVLSYFTLVLGELVPKRVAMKKYEKIAYRNVSIISFISILSAPFVKLLTKSTNLLSKLFGVGEVDESTITEEEIKMMVDEGEEKGAIEEDEREMINNIFEFNDTVTSEVMIHRTDIFSIDINSNFEEILNKLDEYKYSRIPVYEDTIDDIKGILFVKDTLKLLSEGKKVNISQIMKPAFFVAENKPINELFRDMKNKKQQMAIVIDEFGGTAGLVTMEDLIEEIVGNIFDEYDEIENEYEQINENTFMISGSVNMYDLKKILNITIPDGDYDTLSGYLLEELGRVPEDGETPIIDTPKVLYKIVEYEDKRILWVKATKKIV